MMSAPLRWRSNDFPNQGYKEDIGLRPVGVDCALLARGPLFVVSDGLERAMSNFRQLGGAERERRAGDPGGHQRRKRAAVDCTAAQEVAVPLLASGMGDTVTASGPRPRLRSGRNSAHC